MTEWKIYKKFIDWLGKTWWVLPESEHLMPLIRARYTKEEAEFLTGIPHASKSLEELAQIEGMDPDEIGPWLKDLCKKGVLYKTRRGDSVRYRLNDSYFVFFAALSGLEVMMMTAGRWRP